MDKRYQIFVSSTFADLVEERQAVMQALLSLDHFPAGMELFPASDDDQWELIKAVIDDSDYYIIVIAARYGSMTAEGLSYTEMEFDYALERGIPILAFLHQSPEELPAKKTDQNDKARRKLASLRKKVQAGRHVKFWKTPDDLRAKAIQAISAETKRNPRIGWVRANRAMSPEDRQRELRLQDELIAAKAQIEELEREMRDRSVLTADVPRERLSQGADEFCFTLTFKNETSRLIVERVPVSWDDLFRVIGPSAIITLT